MHTMTRASKLTTAAEMATEMAAQYNGFAIVEYGVKPFAYLGPQPYAQLHAVVYTPEMADDIAHMAFNRSFADLCAREYNYAQMTVGVFFGHERIA